MWYETLGVRSRSIPLPPETILDSLPWSSSRAISDRCDLDIRYYQCMPSRRLRLSCRGTEYVRQDHQSYSDHRHYSGHTCGYVVDYQEDERD